MIDNQDFREIFQYLLTTKKVKNVNDFAEKLEIHRTYISQILHDRQIFSQKLYTKIIAEFPEVENITYNIRKDNNEVNNEVVYVEKKYMQKTIKLQEKIIELQNENGELKNKIINLLEKKQ